MTNHTYVPKFGTLKGTLFLLALGLALVVGLALASPTHGAGLSQVEKGDISGQLTVVGQPTAGMTIELRRRSNGGDDALLLSGKTDAAGVYHFAGQPGAPNDAFYYVRALGGKGALSVWYSFPIIYIMGTQVSVPAIELGDVELVGPVQNAALSLPTTLHWKARKMGETYRVFVYTAGKTDKPLLDSGSLGTGTEFAIADGGLPDGKYEALVQVRDTVVGYGQSQSRFHFSVGAAAPEGAASTVSGTQIAPATAPSQGATGTTGTADSTQPSAANPPAQPKGTAAAQPDIKVNLSADKATVGRGEAMTYKVEVQNAGTGAASGLVVTDKLPAGVNVSADQVKSSEGKVTVDVNTGVITLNLDSIAAGSKATVEIPVTVKSDAGSNISNQASAKYTGSDNPTQSNAYIAQVAAPLSGTSGSVQNPAQKPADQPASGQQNNAQAGSSAQPPANQPAAPQDTTAKAPVSNPPAAQPKQQPAAPQAKAPAAPKKAAATVPQTGGSFPIALAAVLLAVTLLARYLRGLLYRRA